MRRIAHIAPGETYGRLTALYTVEGFRGAQVVVTCDCGTIKKLLQIDVYRGRIKSCGCLSADVNRELGLARRLPRPRKRKRYPETAADQQRKMRWAKAKYHANKEQSRELSRQKAARWRAENKERDQETKRAWFDANADDVYRRRNERRASNPEPVKAARRRHYEKHSAAIGRQTAAWRRKNQAHANMIGAARRAAEKRATPGWANKFFMVEIYALARLRTQVLGVEHHVDHIVPLQSKRVCGLHCEANMRVLPAVHNIQKSNVSWPDMPDAHPIFHSPRVVDRQQKRGVA